MWLANASAAEQGARTLEPLQRKEPDQAAEDSRRALPRCAFLLLALAGGITVGTAVATFGAHSGGKESSVPHKLPTLRKGTPLGFLLEATSADPSVFTTRVEAKVLIPGIGEPVPDGVVIFNDRNQILYAGARNAAPVLHANATFKVAAVMPGLWDCHTHFAGPMKLDGEPFKIDGVLSSAPFPMNYVRFHDAVLELKDALMMGITSVRELGGPDGQPLHELLRTRSIEGPNFHFSGRAIGMTSGHTDEQTLPLQVFKWMDENRLTTGALCDGVAECLKRVRENLRMQADVIKVMTSGGVLSEFDQPTDAQFSLEEVQAMTSEARRARRGVAAHAHSTGGIETAILGGVTSIEHGTYMTPGQADEIKRRGMIYTPTATIVQQLFNGTVKPASLDDNQWRKGLATLAQHSITIKMAIAKGVTIVAGTDCPNGCADVGQEVNFLNMFGMTPLQAIRAATGDAPRCLGDFGLAPLSGRLEVDYEADIIALDTSPLEDLKALTRKDSITHVWKAGQLVKAPGGRRIGQERLIAADWHRMASVFPVGS